MQTQRKRKYLLDRGGDLSFQVDSPQLSSPSPTTSGIVAIPDYLLGWYFDHLQ